MRRILIQKSMDFEVENRGNRRQTRIEKSSFFPHGFFINFGSILEGFGAPNGGQDGPKLGKLGIKKAI